MKKIFSCLAVFFVLCCLFSSLKENDPAPLPKMVGSKTAQQPKHSQVPHTVAKGLRQPKIYQSNPTPTSTKEEAPTNWLAEEARMEKQYSEAVRKLNDSCFFYTLMLLQTQKWEKAETEAQYCINHRGIGEQPMLLRNLGWSQFAQGHYDEAQRSFRKAISASYGWDKKTILEWYLDTLQRYDPEDEMETVERMLHDIEVKKH